MRSIYVSIYLQSRYILAERTLIQRDAHLQRLYFLGVVRGTVGMQARMACLTGSKNTATRRSSTLHRLHVRTRHAQRRRLQWKLNNVNK